MRADISFRSLAAAVALMVGGCSGGNTAVNPNLGSDVDQGARSSSSVLRSRTSDTMAQLVSFRSHQATYQGAAWLSPEIRTGEALLYVSQSHNDDIQIYRQSGTNQAPIGMITSGVGNPEGIFVTPNGDLYVANTGAANILVFKRDHLKPYKTLMDPNEYPWDVAVDTDGTVYVSNFSSQSVYPGSVSVYRHGATTPTATYTIPNVEWAMYDAVDDSGTLYVDYVVNQTPKGRLVKYYRGSSTPHPIAVTLCWPGGMQFDNTDDLIALTQFDCLDQGPYVGIYELPTAAPSFTFGSDNIVPVSVALTRDERQVYVGDVLGGVIHRYSYPGGYENDTIVNSEPDGLATDPVAPL